MLMIARRRSRIPWRWIIALLAVLLLAGGLYVLSLVMAPTFSTIVMKPITAKQLETIKPTENRIIIPKIGVNIHYGTDGMTSLNEGALWRYPDRGSPEKGGNFIIAAHRFSIQPTIGGTIIHSPFYHIDKLEQGDQIIVDYNNKRYGYTVEKKEKVPPTAIEIEAPSKEAKLTLYSCELGGSAEGRYVIIAKPLGEVAIKS